MLIEAKRNQRGIVFNTKGATMKALAKQPREQSVGSSISPYGTARATISGSPLSADELRKIHGYWRASLYLSLGMLYLKENPLLREPLVVKHTKPRLLGHWGSDAGQSFTYIHFNRLINKYGLNAIFVSGPRSEEHTSELQSLRHLV